MSTTLITSLVAAGLVILMMIVYANHLLEASRLEKARLKADLSDRVGRCATLAETLPGQLVTPPLKLMLARLELALSERLIPLDRGNDALKARVTELQARVEKGENASDTNPLKPIDKDTKAKDVRFQLEALHGQVLRAAHDGLLNQAESKRWQLHIRDMLVLVHVELFNAMGQQAMQQQLPRQARLAFERGVQYIRKQPDTTPFQQQLSRLEAQLERANAMVLEADAPGTEERSELDTGLEEITDDWKKKNFYE